MSQQAYRRADKKVEIFDFHGGIHPPENKAQSLQLPLGQPKLPNELVLPLGQHIGQASRPLVNIGEKVLKGQTIAINNGFLSSFLHAPTSGTISAIEDRAIAHPSGLSDQCIVITPDGQDRWCELNPLEHWQDLSKPDVLSFLAQMGIVGMGGAGFPTQVKLQGAQKHHVAHLIINAAECEPYITADDTLIREKTDALLSGIQILKSLLDVEDVIIGIEDNKPTAIDILETQIKAQALDIRLAVVPTKYPSGGEKQLIQLLTNKEVPSGKHPIDVGILCQNVGTCVAIHDAICFGKPLISRITTLTGAALDQPQNVEVLLGTPIQHLLEHAAANLDKVQRLIMGGPMMGFTLEDAKVPVVKTTNCILAADAQELPQPEPEQACIRCGMCEQACPASLLPQQLLWFTKSQEFEKAEHYNLFDCIECGACSYVCPSSIPLVQYYRHSKSAIREAKEAHIKSEHAKQRFEARKARQEAEAAEKEAKRVARAEASAKAKAAKAATPKTAPTNTEADTIANASLNQAPVDSPSANNTSVATSADADASKKLKIDHAIAKAKLNKLTKALLQAQEVQNTEEMARLQTEMDEQQKTVTQLDSEMAKYASLSTPAATLQNAATTEPADDAKKLKIDLAIAKAAVKKILKAIDKAEAIEAPELAQLREQHEAAVKRVTDIENSMKHQGNVQSTEGQPKQAIKKDPLQEDIKKQKIAAALAKAQLNKLHVRLEKEPEQADVIQAAIVEKQQDLDTANAELNTLLNQQEKH